MLALARYGRFIQDNEVYLTVLEQIDGGEVMDNLYERLAQELGKAQRDQIFQGIELPTWGTPNTQRANMMQVIIERLERLTDSETYNHIFKDSLRDLPDEYYLKDKRKYAKTKMLTSNPRAPGSFWSI